MRLTIALMLSFQMISLPVVARTGQKTDVTPTQIFVDAFTAAEAKVWEQQVRSGLEKLNSQGLDMFLDTNFIDVTGEDATALKEMKKFTKNTTPEFTETDFGEWRFKSKGHTLSFTLTTLHEGHAYIDGEKFSYTGLTLAQLKTKLESWEPTKRTTFLRTLNTLVGIGEAEAIGPAILIVALFAAALVGYAFYKLKWQPTSAVKKINEIKNLLDQKNRACESSPNSSTGFDEAVELVKPIQNFNNKFEVALKNMVGSSVITGKSCYEAAHEAGRAIGTDIPVLSDSQIRLMEMNEGPTKFVAETDVRGALFNMCRSFTQLKSCMGTFAERNVSKKQYKLLEDEIKHKLKSLESSSKQ